MRRKPPPLLPIFRSEAQARLLALLFLNPERSWSSPELQQRLDVPEPTLRRELNRLGEAGLVTSERVGRTRLSTAATDSVLYEPLRELLERTLGVEAALARRLVEIDGVEAAALFGSWARGTGVRPASDVDLLVVGDADFDEVAQAAREVEEIAGREIHVFLYSRDELFEKEAEGSGFVRALLGGDLKPLVGDVRPDRESPGKTDPMSLPRQSTEMPGQPSEVFEIGKSHLERLRQAVDELLEGARPQRRECRLSRAS